MHKNIKEQILNMEKEHPGYMDKLKEVMDFIFSIEDIYDVFDKCKAPEMRKHEDEDYTEKDYVAEQFDYLYDRLYVKTQMLGKFFPPPAPFVSLYILDKLIYHPTLRTLVRLYDSMAYTIGEEWIVYHRSFINGLTGLTGGKCPYTFMQLLEFLNETILNELNSKNEDIYYNLSNAVEKKFCWQNGNSDEKKELIDSIRNGSITDRLPKFFEWWEDAEKLLLSLPDEKIIASNNIPMTMLYYDTRGWYRYIEKKYDDEAYTRRETTMALYAKLALRFAGFEISNDFLKAMFLAINCNIYSYLIYSIPKYTELASGLYRKADPALADEIIATGKKVIKNLSEAKFEYDYTGQIICVMNRFDQLLYDLYKRFDKAAEKVRRSINTPEECVKLARIYAAEQNYENSVFVIYENGTVISEDIDNYDSKSDEEKKKEAIAKANNAVKYTADFDDDIMGDERRNEYGDFVGCGYIGGYGGAHYYWSSGAFLDTDMDIARELNDRDATEKNIVDFVFYDPTKDKKSDS